MLTISAMHSTHGHAHALYKAIVQTKKFTEYALWIDTPSGSSSLMLLTMSCIGAAYTVIRQISDMRLRLVKNESVASRLRSLKSFLYADCSFLC